MLQCPSVRLSSSPFPTLLALLLGCWPGDFVTTRPLSAEYVPLPALQYPLCLKLMESKRVDVSMMITHRFGFSENEVHAAFDCAARAAQTGAIKVMFNLVDEDDLE